MAENLWSEMAIVIAAIIISFLVGRQVDKESGSSEERYLVRCKRNAKPG